jgi:hypothetical protein
MADLESWAPGAVTAAVSVVAAVVSTVMWFRARGERRKAAVQAKLATDAAVASEGHLDRIAEVQVQQHETTTARLTAKERDPWQMRRGHDEATFYNDTTTPKYNVKIEIKAADQPWIEEVFPYVGPQRRVSVDYAAVGAPMSATITWHLLDDCSDTIPPQIYTW